VIIIAQKFSTMGNLKQFLQAKSQRFLSVYLGLAGFSTYFCMYAFRKPFTAGNFHDIVLWGIDYKIILVISQVLGYATAKGLGIKFVSEILPQNRVKNILWMIGFACLNLLFFAIIKPPYNFIFLYFNGLGLGMVFGLVFSFLEGRQITEILGASLSISFIVSSGIVKSIGKYFINLGINEYWMPFWVGLIFFPSLLVSVYALSIAPNPTKIDQKERSERLPMDGQDRIKFIKKYGFGLIPLIIVYILMTILRDIRDNFGVEIWKVLGVNDASIFTKTESLIGLMICFLTALIYFVKDHKKAFWLNHLMIFVGCFLILISALLFQNHQLNAFDWAVLMGIGLYMAYVPYNGMLFDRLLAVLKEKGNVGFLFYLADFSGYLATVFILIYQNFGTQKISWLGFLMGLAQILPIFCIVSVTVSYFYFNWKLNTVKGIRKSPFKRITSV
jgi:Family of unknown function (DUF5690)